MAQAPVTLSRLSSATQADLKFCKSQEVGAEMFLICYHNDSAQT